MCCKSGRVLRLIGQRIAHSTLPALPAVPCRRPRAQMRLWMRGATGCCFEVARRRLSRCPFYRGGLFVEACIRPTRSSATRRWSGATGAARRPRWIEQGSGLCFEPTEHQLHDLLSRCCTKPFRPQRHLHQPESGRRGSGWTGLGYSRFWNGLFFTRHTASSKASIEVR